MNNSSNLKSALVDPNTVPNVQKSVSFSNTELIEIEDNSQPTQEESMKQKILQNDQKAESKEEKLARLRVEIKARGEFYKVTYIF